MRETLEKYRDRIRRGEVDPVAHWDGQTTGLLLNPEDETVPLNLLGFGACRLEADPCWLDTGNRELALIPLDAEFEIRIGPEVLRGQRSSPFSTRPGASNAWAVYAPAGSTVKLAGKGELIYYTAPARSHKPPAVVRPGQRQDLICGAGVWRREAVVLLSPEDLTTSLVIGETYSPPGLWSGTPLHVHDADDPQGGQSDHEEVYFHLARNPGGQWGPYSVQMLFDDRGLNNAYVVHDHDAVAIPGAAHPVVAGPASDLLYIWGLAGHGSSLKMCDVPEFAFLKRVSDALDRLTAAHPRGALSDAAFNAVVSETALTAEQAHNLRMHLAQQGFEIGKP